MSILLTYLYPILFSVVFGYYNGWQWIDEQDGVYDPKKAKKRWKAASVFLRGLALAGVCGFSIIDISWNHLPLAASISLPIFDITINLVARKPVFYLGTTSKTDALGKWKWVAYAALMVGAFFII